MQTAKWIIKRKDVLFSDRKRWVNSKARLVTRGFKPVQVVECNETFALAIRFGAITPFHVIVASKNLGMHQMDVKPAFSDTNLYEIYIK